MTQGFARYNVMRVRYAKIRIQSKSEITCYCSGLKMNTYFQMRPNLNL